MTIDTLILMKELLENEVKTRETACREVHKIRMDAKDADDWGKYDTMQEIERTQWDRLDDARYALREFMGHDWR